MLLSLFGEGARKGNSPSRSRPPERIRNTTPFERVGALGNLLPTYAAVRRD
jgi:hypothetical protein